jgi:hypothetical protein
MTFCMRVSTAMVALAVVGVASHSAFAQRYRGGGSIRYSASFANRANNFSNADRQQVTDLRNRYSYRGGRWDSGNRGVDAYGTQNLTGADRQRRRQAAWRPSVGRPTTYGSVHTGGKYHLPTMPHNPYTGPASPTSYASRATTSYKVPTYGSRRSAPTLYQLPTGSTGVTVGGSRYLTHGHTWYKPQKKGGQTHYKWAYPPAGHWYTSLPSGAVEVRQGGVTYHYHGGVYYKTGAKDGQSGYVVAKAPKGSPPRSPDPDKDPLKILKAACEHIAGLNGLSGVVETAIDDIKPTGSKIKLSQQRVVYVSRPDKMTVDVSGDGEDKRVVYDGRTIALFDRKRKTYAVADMPGSIGKMTEKLVTDYAVVLPMSDFLRDGAYDSLAATIVSSQYLGTEKVGKAECHHLAFVSGDVDWQVWISFGDKPVPRKIVIDHRHERSRPRYVATIVAWVENPTFKPSTFEFKPPAGARQVEMMPVRKQDNTVPEQK